MTGNDYLYYTDKSLVQLPRSTIQYINATMCWHQHSADNFNKQQNQQKYYTSNVHQIKLLKIHTEIDRRGNTNYDFRLKTKLMNCSQPMVIQPSQSVSNWRKEAVRVYRKQHKCKYWLNSKSYKKINMTDIKARGKNSTYAINTLQ